MKFNIGDKVRIKDKLESGALYGDYMVIEDMVKLAGEEATVVTVGDDYVELDISKGRWFWTKGMIELVEKRVVILSPEIPQFVADWIEEKKKSVDLSDVVHNLPANIHTWAYAQDGESEELKTLATAWYYGYVVKDESKYTVYLESKRDGEVCDAAYLFRRCNGIVDIGRSFERYDKTGDRFQLTEAEIKEYAPDFWTIAEKVDTDKI